MPEIDKREARRRILDTAESLFGKRGFDAVSVAEIAGEAGVSTALIYYHFTDKESLLRALLESANEVFAPFAADLVESDGTALDRLERYVDAWLAAVMDHQSLVRILVRPLTDPEGPLSAEILKRISGNIEAIAGAIEQGVKAGEFRKIDPYLAAEGLFALLNTRVAAGVFDASFSTRVSASASSVAEFIKRVYLGGLKAYPAEAQSEC